MPEKTPPQMPKPQEQGAEAELAFSRRVPSGDNLERDICDRCGFINYVNPRIVVGSVVTHDGKFLLCRRAIEPRRGYWTLPAGFMEQGETTDEGARREAREEANAEIVLRDVLAIYNIPRIAQVQIMYRAELREPSFSAGEETLEAGLFEWKDIPWEELAFPSVYWALMHHREAMGKDAIAPFTNPEGENGNLFPRRPAGV
ncbi:NUDIX hydrolase [Parvibaculum lavamentivorans]|nr:NUDIX hydrolase [Parvibaculum lavamentivorans]